MAGLYIHVPFCKQRCIYCDFFSGTNLSVSRRYLEALSLEMDRYVDFFDNNEVRTIYFGGGTPSLLSIADIDYVLRSVQRHWKLSGLEEMTIECNPDDLNEEYLSGLKSLGFNRLSVGLQSMDDDMLKWMNRRHTVDGAVKAVELANRVGFDNISVDLIFGLPGQDVLRLQQTVREVLALGIQHVSAYSLMVESKKMQMLVEDGRLKLPTEDECVAMFDVISSDLGRAGFIQYEISNYALPGFQSKHNSSYWDGTPYLGLGPAASSFDGNSRWTNVRHTVRYCSALEGGGDIAEREMLTEEERLEERIFLSLRTRRGIDLSAVGKEFGRGAAEKLVGLAQRYIDSGHVVFEDNRLCLSHKGVFVSDMIMADLMG